MGIANTIALLGGLAFFLFGMSLLGEGLKRVAGSKLEIILEKLTSTAFRGVLLGTVVTAAIQSSSATTVMVVGFVNSGIMKLTNAIGIIMGANIGTTATGWILVLAGVEGGGISSSTVFAFVAFIGIVLYFFCKKPTQKNIGMILLAFSVLMSGMQSMAAVWPENNRESSSGMPDARPRKRNSCAASQKRETRRRCTGNCAWYAAGSWRRSTSSSDGWTVWIF